MSRSAGPSLLARHRAAEARAGSLAAQVPWWGWVSDRTLLTRQGELLAAAALQPRTRTALSSARMDQVIGAWARMLAALPVGGRCQIVFLRTPMAAAPLSPAGSALAREVQHSRQRWIESRCYSSRAYAVWTSRPDWFSGEERVGFFGGLADMLGLASSHRLRAVRASELRRATADFERLAEALAGMVSDVTPCTLLGRAEATRVLCETLNGPAALPPAASRDLLYWRIARAPVEVWRKSLSVDGRRAVMFSMQSPPPECWRDMIPEAWDLPCETSCVWSFRQIGLPAARKKLRSLASAYNKRRFSAMAAARGIEGSSLAMEDTGAARDVAELQEALAGLQNGIGIGESFLAFGLHGEEVEIRAAEPLLLRAFAAVDGKLARETFGSAPVYFGRLPGNLPERMPRTCLVSAPAAACMAPLFGSGQGHRRCKHLGGRPPLTIFETRQKSPYFFDIFGGADVGHGLVLGATGAGKSFLLNFLLLTALQYDPLVGVLDLGGSYEAVTRLARGALVRIGKDTSTRLGPFALPDTRETHKFLGAFVMRLLRHGGVTPDGGAITDITGLVRDIYRLPARHRTLSSLRGLLHPRLKSGLDLWCEGGLWGHIFDGPPDDSLELRDWQVVDLAGCDRFPELADAALNYFLELFRLRIENEDEISRLKILVIDEAWRFLMEPATAAWIAEAAKTWRKKNGCLWIATQSPEDLLSEGRAPPLLDSLASRIYLANPEMPAHAGEVLQLTDAEIELIRTLQPKRELYLRRRDEREVLQLAVDPSSYWLFTSNPVEAAQRNEVLARYGFREGLARLARARSG